MNKALYSIFSIVWIAISYPVFAACDGRLTPVNRFDSLEADFAQSIFMYRGATAYYIGGDPGFLLTAHHATTDASGGKQEVCSPYISQSDSDQICIDVSVISVGLPEWDLALLQLTEELPIRLRPLELALSDVPVYGNDIYRIFGYSKPTEGIEPSWSVSLGSIRQLARVEATKGKNPLVNKPIYFVDADQYAGASGGPIVGPNGAVWATAVREVDFNQQAYGIPHRSRDFMAWIVDNTAPSNDATQWIKKGLTGGLTNELFQSQFTHALDVRRRTLSNLDILHISEALVNGGKARLWYDLLLCPLAKVTGSVVDWDVFEDINPISGVSYAAIEATEIAKEEVWRLAALTESPGEKAALYARSGHLAQVAARMLAKRGNLSSQVTSIETATSADAFIAATNSISGNEQLPILFFGESTSEIREFIRVDDRILRNLDDAANGYSSAYRITPDANLFANSVVSGMLAISTREGDGGGSSSWESTRMALTSMEAPDGSEVRYGMFQDSLPSDPSRKLSEEELRTMFETTTELIESVVTILGTTL